ncbi:hypothetical protein [Pseudomonas sp. TWI628]|uniref:hypothetical protein n=1 Tax=Pseudomonas sp. TWI628 TaxID=3136788 RepID=UPI00320A6038
MLRAELADRRACRFFASLSAEHFRTYEMKRAEFLEHQDTKDFISWLILYLPALSVHLKVLKTDFVHEKIDCQVKGIEADGSFIAWAHKVESFW